jgi:hypothetical protein
MTITNGEVRMRIYGGDGRGVYKWVFAGNAHTGFNESIDPKINAGNFEFVAQATRRNKLKEKKNGKK